MNLGLDRNIFDQQYFERKIVDLKHFPTLMFFLSNMFDQKYVEQKIVDLKNISNHVSFQLIFDQTYFERK